MAFGDYEQIEKARRAAWKRQLYSGRWATEDHAVNERRYKELNDRREKYLRDLLARLTFAWHVEHAYTPRETGSYGGADHIVVGEEVRIGRLVRQPGDALSRPRKKFWGLSPVFEKDRLPSSIADIKIAERIVAATPKKSAVQMDREIAEALKRDH